MRGGRQLLDLINEVLDIARIESGNMEFRLEPVAVGELVSSAVLLVEPLARARGIRFGPVPGRASCPDVVADRARLSQVFINLLSNAIKYNREGGAVTFGYEAGGEGRVRFVVSDTGTGMTAEEVTRLFTPFERLDAPRRGVEGTGLGLAIARRLIQAMDGTLGVRTEPGLGSAFFVDLPAATGGTVVPAPVTLPQLMADGRNAPPGAPSAASARQPALLHVQARRSEREWIDDALHARPHLRLLESADGETGLVIARVSRPDVILLDSHLPDMDAAEFLRRLRGDTADAPPVILLVPAGGDSREEILRDLGVMEVLAKPLDPELLLDEVDRALGRSG